MHKIIYFQKILGKNLGITSKFRCGRVTLNTGIFYFGLRELLMLKRACSATEARLYLENLDVNKMPSLYNAGAQWLSGRVLDSRPRGRGFEPQRHHCVVSFSKNIYPSLVLVQPRKTSPFITERLLMRRKESNQTNKIFIMLCLWSLGIDCTI